MFGKNASRFFGESALFFTGPEFTVPFLEPIDLLDVKLKIRLKPVGNVAARMTASTFLDFLRTSTPTFI